MIEFRITNKKLGIKKIFHTFILYIKGYHLLTIQESINEVMKHLKGTLNAQFISFTIREEGYKMIQGMYFV